MKVIIAVAVTVVVLVLTAPSSFSQEPARREMFVGYSNLQGEGLPNRNNPNGLFDTDFFRNRTTLQGVNAEVSGFPWSSFGLTGDFSFNRNGRTVDFAGGRNSMHTDIFTTSRRVQPSAGVTLPGLNLSLGFLAERRTRDSTPAAVWKCRRAQPQKRRLRRHPRISR